MIEKAIIAAVNITSENQNIEYELDELRNLCAACDIEVVDAIVQNVNHIHPTFYMGRGKLEEIQAIIEHYEIEIIVFNDELSPSQIRSIEKLLKITVFDRTFIILEIFRRRAQTKEAILQVEIATLNYLLPRLVGMREGLSRQRGVGSSAQRGRGGGETKLELDRRHIQSRISQLNHELKELTKLRYQQRIKRKKNLTPVVSIVGYTNSGKSTLLNSLLDYSTETKKNVFEKDMLFATLETSTRKIKLENKPEFLVTDTVGFVQKLPHQLVEAFKSTLEEITESDLIVHVVDSSNHEYEEQIKVTNAVLKELGVKDIPVIYAFNKIDLFDEYFYIEPEYYNAIRISAKDKTNVIELLNMIHNLLFQDYEVCTFIIPFEEGQLVSYLQDNTEVEHIEYLHHGTKVEARVSTYFKTKYSDYLV